MFTPVTWSGRAYKWIYVTAALELVLAAVFFVIGMNNALVRSGFYLTAAILGVVGILLLLWGRRWARGYQEAQRLRVQGVPGQAQIVGMRQTGVSLNDQPQIELNLSVQTEMQGAYPVTVKEYVPMMMLGALSSGRPLPVKVDPANPQRLVVEWESAMSLPMDTAVDQIPQFPAEANAEKQRILATGIAGTARIVSTAPTGNFDDQGRPIHTMMLVIEIPGREPIQGPAMAGIPPERAEQLEAGDEVPVKTDPNDPTKVAIDWDNA
jgi:hypothetical protein